jgi:DNA-directed RNA polymerase subunit M/transcription elongation factor TFIIS
MLRKLGAIINNQFINPLCAIKNSENKFKCPDCDNLLILKKGKIRQPHFSHKIKCSYNNVNQFIDTKNKIQRDGIELKRQCIQCNEISNIMCEPSDNIQINNSTIILNKNKIIELGYIQHEINNEVYKLNNDVYESQNYICKDCIHGQVYFNQRGAGCGKTYESIQLLNKSSFKTKKIILYLTKTHSAKEVIYGEFKEQYNAGHIHNISLVSETLDKRYKLVLRREEDDNELIILIGTIDSFTYTV